MRKGSRARREGRKREGEEWLCERQRARCNSLDRHFEGRSGSRLDLVKMGEGGRMEGRGRRREGKEEKWLEVGSVVRKVKVERVKIVK